MLATDWLLGIDSRAMTAQSQTTTNQSQTTTCHQLTTTYHQLTTTHHPQAHPPLHTNPSPPPIHPFQFSTFHYYLPFQIMKGSPRKHDHFQIDDFSKTTFVSLIQDKPHNINKEQSEWKEVDPSIRTPSPKWTLVPIQSSLPFSPIFRFRDH